MTNNKQEEFNNAGNDELTAEEMNKRVEEEKERITESHGGIEGTPIESQPLQLQAEKEAKELEKSRQAQAQAQQKPPQQAQAQHQEPQQKTQSQK